MIHHPIPPFCPTHARVLILGSFPSVKSREQCFYYAHPQNRFWQILASVFSYPVPQSIEEKKCLLTQCGIALWDVVGQCEIHGSADSSIRSVTPNDIPSLLQKCPDARIFVNGKTAEKYYKRYLQPILHRDATVLPCSSAANASWSLPRLIATWQVLCI